MTRAVKAYSILWSFPRVVARPWQNCLFPRSKKINRIERKVDRRSPEREKKKEIKKDRKRNKEGRRLALICSPPQILAAKHRAQAAQRSLENKQTRSRAFYGSNLREPETHLLNAACLPRGDSLINVTRDLPSKRRRWPALYIYIYIYQIRRNVVVPRLLQLECENDKRLRRRNSLCLSEIVSSRAPSDTIPYFSSLSCVDRWKGRI